MSFQVSRDLKAFSAAHRLNKSYPGKCQTLHGHTYAASVVIRADTLDQYDFVIDFDDVKRLFDNWVQSHWDHVTLVSEMDVSLLEFLKAEDQAYFVLPGQRNTTCEAMTEFLFKTFNELLRNEMPDQAGRLQVVSVHISESAFSHASYSLLPNL